MRARLAPFPVGAVALHRARHGCGLTGSLSRSERHDASRRAMFHEMTLSMLAKQLAYRDTADGSTGTGVSHAGARRPIRGRGVGLHCDLQGSSGLQGGRDC